MNKQASVGANVKDGEKDVKQKECDSAYKSPLKRKKGTEKVTEDELKKSYVDVDNLTASSSSNATRDPGVNNILIQILATLMLRNQLKSFRSVRFGHYIVIMMGSQNFMARSRKSILAQS